MKIKNRTTIGITLALVVIGIFAGAKFVRAYPSYFTMQRTATATSSVSYMTAGTATTTQNFFNTAQFITDEDSDQNQLFLAFVASSSSSVLNWTNQFSNNNIDWYNEDAVIIPTSGVTYNSIDHASTTVTHVWKPGVAATSTKTIALPNNVARYVRTVFSLPAGSAAGAVYVEAISKRLPGSANQ